MKHSNDKNQPDPLLEIDRFKEVEESTQCKWVIDNFCIKTMFFLVALCYLFVTGY